jgi:hypothetical protein
MQVEPHEGGRLTELVSRHDVCATATRIGADRLSIREHHDARIAVMMNAIGVAIVSAPTPTRISTRRISSVAYATDENGWDERTARPVSRERRVMSEMERNRRTNDESFDL